MRHAALLLLSLCSTAVAAPGAGAPANPAATRPGPADDMAEVPMAPPINPDELARRAGKHLGLTKDERPEILSEDLIRSIAHGSIKLDRFLDPKHKVAMISRMGSACGDGDGCKRADTATRTPLAYVKAMVKAEQLDMPMTCDNAFLATPDPDLGARDVHGERDPRRKPKSARYATCTVPGPAEYAETFHLVFVPDARRGLRLAAAISVDVGSATDWRSLISFWF